MNPDLICPPIDRLDFGVCLREGDQRSVFRVPIRPEVEVVFQEALGKTVEALKGDEHESLTGLVNYDPAEKHETHDPCIVQLASPWLAKIRDLVEMTDFETNGTVLRDNPSKIFYYFCRFKKEQNYFWGIRKATQFKSSLKTKNAFLQGDELNLVGGNVFRLDDFFDAVITDDKAYILRPKDFEYVADLVQVMRNTAAASIRVVDEQLPFVDLSGLATQMERGGSIRRARLAASVAARTDLNLTDRNLFAEACTNSGIILEENDGILSASAEQSWDLLTVLDRRRYWVNLIAGQHEIYEAASRERV
jgi:hypothetical protein